MPRKKAESAVIDTVIPTDPTMGEITAALRHLEHENVELTEALSSVATMFATEDQGWNLLSGGYERYGITLVQLRQVSLQIREQLAGASVIKRGAELRAQYVWGKGVDIAGVYRDEGAKGNTSSLQKLYADAVNKQVLFGHDAHQELERAAFSDGNILMLFDKDARQYRNLPIWEVTGEVRNPDYDDEIWLVRRTWSHWTYGESPEVRVAWYPTQYYSGSRNILVNNDEPVDFSKTVYIKRFNRQAGWAWGIPDALPVIAWAKLYSEFLKNGKVMTQALAQFAFKVISNNKTAQAAAQSAITAGRTTPSQGGSGGTAVMGMGTDLQALSSAGKGYDFNSGRPLAAMIAAGLEVSLVPLLSDPGAAGSSYGSASTLDAPTQLAMQSRQNSWKQYLEELLGGALGAGNTPKIVFPPIVDPDAFRLTQGLSMILGNGAMHLDDYWYTLMDAWKINSAHTSPPSGFQPFNQKPSKPSALDASTTDQAIPNPVASGTAGSSGNGGNAAPTQGSNATGVQGKTLNANDLRKDKISEMAAQLVMEDSVNEMRSILQEMRDLKNS